MKIVAKEYAHVEIEEAHYKLGVFYPAKVERIPTGKEWELDISTETISKGWASVIGDLQELLYHFRTTLNR